MGKIVYEHRVKQTKAQKSMDKIDAERGKIALEREKAEFQKERAESQKERAAQTAARHERGEYSFGERCGLLLAGGITAACGLICMPSAEGGVAMGLAILAVGGVLIFLGLRKMKKVDAIAAEARRAWELKEKAAEKRVACPHCGAQTAEGEACEYCGGKLS